MNGFTHMDPHGSGPTLRQALENAWVTLPCAYAGHTACWTSNGGEHHFAIGGTGSFPTDFVVKPRKGPPSASWSAMKRLIGARRAAFIRKLYRGAMRYV